MAGFWENRCKEFPIDSRHSIGHELCPSPSRHISVLRTTNRNPYSLCSRSVRKKHLSSTSHKDTLMTYCSIILRGISVRCILISLRSKTRRRATLLFPTLICSHRLGWTVDFALPFTTSLMISLPYHKLSVLRYQHPIFTRRLAFFFNYHNLSDTPGLAPYMTLLF